MSDDTIPATPGPAPVTPTPTPPVSPLAELTAPPGTALQIAQMLAAGKIDTTQAGKLSKAGSISTSAVAQALHTLREVGETQQDGRSPEVRQLDVLYPRAKETDFNAIQYYAPGQAPAVLPKEVQAFDGSVRAWMGPEGAGLSVEAGNSLVTTLSKAIQHTHAMTAEQRETYKDQENAKLHQLFGGQDKLEAMLQPAAVMIHELDQKRPGLKEFVRAHGDHALFVAQLIQAARIYHARKGR